MTPIRDRLEHSRYDAVVVGSGPNGFAAAITVAQTGRRVALLEAQPTLGGGLRSAELTLPGFVHDVCSAIHPMGEHSPFLRTLELPIEWVYPPTQVAHPLDDAPAVLLRGFGAATAGRTVREAVTRAWFLEQAAAAYLAAAAAGTPRPFEATSAAPFLAADGPAAAQIDRLWHYLRRRWAPDHKD